MSITLPNIALKGGFADGVDDWGADMNANLLKLAVLTQAGILSRVAAVPADPVDGAVYVLTAAPNANAVAAYSNGAWAYFLPSEGWLVYDRGADTYISFNGNAWVPFTGGGGGEGLPAGGTTGQVLGKLSNADGDADWIDQTGDGGGGGGASKAKYTRLTLAANVPVPTGSWKLIPWVLKDDTAGAFDAATPTDVTVPAGMTVARITGRVGWADGGSTRAIHCVGGDGRTLALDIRSGAFESGSSVSSGGWVAVTPGEKITLQANSFASASSILGTNTFGGLPQFQFEWAPDMEAASTGGGKSRKPAAPYWRARCLYTTSNAFAIADIQMRGAAGGPNQAVGGVAVASHEEFGAAADAFDGNGATFWATAPNSGRWLGYHFAAPVAIEEITVKSRAGAEASQAPLTIAIDYSMDGYAWKNAWLAENFAAWGAAETRTFTDTTP